MVMMMRICCTIGLEEVIEVVEEVEVVVGIT